jgi:hypothetical protein
MITCRLNRNIYKTVQSVTSVVYVSGMKRQWDRNRAGGRASGPSQQESLPRQTLNRRNTANTNV